MKLLPLSRQAKNKRLSLKEKKRRQIVESYEAISKSRSTTRSDQNNEWDALCALLAPVAAADYKFLGGDQPVSRMRGSMGVFSWEGTVALATSRRSWSEEHLVLADRKLSSTSRAPSVSISVDSIISVRALAQHESPVARFPCFQVETFVRVFYFMVASPARLAEWLDAFRAVAPSVLLDENESPRELSAIFNEQVEPDIPYLAMPSCWKVERRRVLNYRRIIFRHPSVNRGEGDQDGIHQGGQEQWPTPGKNEGTSDILRSCMGMGPCAVVELLLKQALELSYHKGREDPRLWISFMDTLSFLQVLSLEGLDNSKRSALLLNLYHVMVLHGNIVFHPPRAKNNWSKFFNTVAYLIGFDLVSAFELEHNVLRAAMTRPSFFQIFQKDMKLPTSVYPDLALAQGDFRFNFCINSGVLTMPAVIPMYKPHLLDSQLDRATAMMLRERVVVDAGRRTVQLPRCCSVYMADFSPSRSSTTAPSPKDCLRVIVYYLPEPKRSSLMEMLRDEGSVSVRFAKISYRSTNLSYIDLDGDDEKESDAHSSRA